MDGKPDHLYLNTIYRILKIHSSLKQAPKSRKRWPRYSLGAKSSSPTRLYHLRTYLTMS